MNYLEWFPKILKQLLILFFLKRKEKKEDFYVIKNFKNMKIIFISNKRLLLPF